MPSAAVECLSQLSADGGYLTTDRGPQEPTDSCQGTTDRRPEGQGNFTAPPVHPKFGAPLQVLYQVPGSCIYVDVGLAEGIKE